MKIHEHQAVTLLEKYGVPNSGGMVAFTADEAVEAAKKIPGNVWVVKAQIHAGGRGKAGGVKLAKSLDQVKEIANELLGKVLVTHQTGPEGKLVRRLMVAGGVDIKKEYYLSLVLDSDTAKVVLMASAEGGMEIEEVAAKTPEKIFKEYIDTQIGLRNFQILNVAKKMGFDKQQTKEFGIIAQGLYKIFMDKDCSLVEVNPLIVTGEGHMQALDIKMDFDNNALFRHKDIEEMRDIYEEDPKEVEASKFNLNYVPLDGNIGCMVNGAGLAMATMDIIKAFGGQPANFLDVGGGATKENVAGAFRILLSDKNVKGILVNIFGGIMRCDIIAEGVVAAAKEINVQVPLVVRLQGTNSEQGREILANSGLNIIPATDMDEAAKKIVAAIK